jgi:hypothetical protein
VAVAALVAITLFQTLVALAALELSSFVIQALNADQVALLLALADTPITPSPLLEHTPHKEKRICQ